MVREAITSDLVPPPSSHGLQQLLSDISSHRHWSRGSSAHDSRTRVETTSAKADLMVRGSLRLAGYVWIARRSPRITTTWGRRSLDGRDKRRQLKVSSRSTDHRSRW